MKKTFTITTLGCKVNQYESDVIAKGLENSGFKRLRSSRGIEHPDVCIVNTCTVTQKASMQSRQTIRQLVRKHPDALMIVTGCYAQTEPDVLRKIDGVHQVVGHRDKHRIPAMLSSPHTLFDDLSKDIEKNAGPHHFSKSTPLTAASGRTRPFLKIQDGCDAFCTYCIVPHARGSSRSMPVKSVLSHITGIKTAGFHEVVLTGIHLGRYGLDLDPPTTLYSLLNQIRKEKQIDRLRLSSIEPVELSSDIIGLAAESENRGGEICRHFHIPLQSGDDAILKRMSRPYRRDTFEKLVGTIKKSIPDAGIGADVLIGFPGETDEAFEQTYSLIDNLPLTYLHVFPFSSREGTPASRFTDKIPDPFIKERCSRIRQLGLRKKHAFYSSLVGCSYSVLIENRRDRQTNLLKGITTNYVPVLIEGSDDLMNTFQEIRIEECGSDNVVAGELISEVPSPS